MSPSKIDSLDGRRRDDEPLVWKPWQPPAGWQAPTTGKLGAAEQAAQHVARGPRLSTDDLHLQAGGASVGRGGRVPKVDLDALAANVDKIHQPTASRALAELGTLRAFAKVADVYARDTFQPSAIAQSLSDFASHLTGAAAKLQATPGVDVVLDTFGGVGAIASGVAKLRDELAGAAAEGRSGLQRALGAASGAARLVGGLATALAALVPPLAPVGAAIVAAGAAFDLGKLAWENQDKMKATLGKAADRLNKVVSNNGASMQDGDVARLVGNNGAAFAEPSAPLKVIANNGARAVGDSSGFGWLTG